MTAGEKPVGIAVDRDPAIQEAKEPVINLVEKANWLLYRRGLITHESVIRNEDNPDGVRRPLFLRARRAKILEEIRSLSPGNRDKKQRLIDRANALDIIAMQYLNQSELSVTLPGLGTQSAKSIEINPPDSLISPDDRQKPPIFVIPGIAGDIETVGNFITEIALSGRRVVAVGYPDSFNGFATEEFVNAVNEDKGFGPHAAFFRAAADYFVGDSSKRELWGYSTGGPILAEILSDPEYAESVEHAVFVNPASVVDQSIASLKIGFISDIVFVRERGTLPNFSYTAGLRQEDMGRNDKETRRKSFNAQVERIATRSDAWSTARVSEGGTMTIVSSENDRVTKTSEARDSFDSMKLVEIPGGHHATAMVQPERIIPLIFAARK